MDFTIIYNDGNGKMTLHCDYFFEKHNGKFIHTIKPDIYKVLKLLHNWEHCNDADKLMKWLSEHNCEELVKYYREKYSRSK